MNPKAAEFLKEASQFQLGQLPTESFHPKTIHLSKLATNDLPEALRLLAEVELDAAKILKSHLQDIENLKKDIASTIQNGGRIFLCGCGATGRLSISLETLWRQQLTPSHPQCDQIRSFIAGGDFALIKSIENFEDHPEFGVRQLHDLGFSKKDLLIATSEGGETPFVIGAAEEAAKISDIKPYFMFCNPKDLLIATADRSKRIIENPRINCISFFTGPMAISGSTRLQATTVLMLAAGSAMFSFIQNVPVSEIIEEFLTGLKSTQWKSLAPLIVAEAEAYRQKKHLIHIASDHAITVLTDTTERTPTFSLLPFENPQLNEPCSWTYMCLPEAADSKQAWDKILKRPLRSIEWSQYKNEFGPDRSLQYDFSEQALVRRTKALAGLVKFEVIDLPKVVQLKLNQEVFELTKPKCLLVEHLLLKVAMNMSSSLVMCKLGRVFGNVMVYVRPTNKKLIDRSIRYVNFLLEEHDLHPPSYEQICESVFEVFDQSKVDEPVVMKVFEKLKSQISAKNGSTKILNLSKESSKS